MLIQDKRKISEKLKDLILEQKMTSFTPDYVGKAKDYEALGIMISQYCEWNGVKITQTFIEALTDSNFHSEATDIEERILQPLLNGKGYPDKK